MHSSPPVASAAISCKAVVPLFIVAPTVCVFLCLVLKEERAGCSTLSSCRLVAVSALCLFLMVPWIGLQCVIVVHCISWSYSFFVDNVCIQAGGFNILPFEAPFPHEADTKLVTFVHFRDIHENFRLDV